MGMSAFSCLRIKGSIAEFRVGQTLGCKTGGRRTNNGDTPPQLALEFEVVNLEATLLADGCLTRYNPDDESGR
jgi:hypothetical protein